MTGGMEPGCTELCDHQAQHQSPSKFVAMNLKCRLVNMAVYFLIIQW